MYSEMIEKVAPFPELFTAIRILAFHNSSDPFSDGMFEPQNLERACIWYMFAFTDTMECG